MTPLDDLLTKHPVPGWRPIAWVLMILIGSLLAWATFAHLDEVAVATGEVVPQGKVKVIQHLEGGIVQKINVAEGDAVREGDSLVLLELAPTNMNRDEIQARLDSLFLSKARLEAEANGTALALPVEPSRRRPEVAHAERETFEARRQELSSVVGGLEEQARQRELAAKEFEATSRSKSNELRLAREKLKISTSLLEGNLTSRLDHLQVERDAEKLAGEIATLEMSIPRARSGLAETRERIREERTKVVRQAHEDLSKVETDIARVRELLTEATGQARRAEIRSPIDGIVKNMRYNTIGGVVRSGEPIMEIVPLNENLVIEAKLSPTDRGYVTVDQYALVKVSTFDYVRYGGLAGKVVNIAADANLDSQGQPYFKVIVQTTKSYLGDDPAQYAITPGMQALVDIHTGSKSVLDYLIRPVLKLKHEGFRER
ncbi:MAG: HlyD family type I secretion periplasmic adaptor subunit [Rhodospirillaceae bacterium]|nr:HlyD family type I secretion periplasmic adaptor subunit [Rhodospirillaceae bacterium]